MRVKPRLCCWEQQLYSSQRNPLLQERRVEVPFNFWMRVKPCLCCWDQQLYSFPRKHWLQEWRAKVPCNFWMRVKPRLCCWDQQLYSSPRVAITSDHLFSLVVFPWLCTYVLRWSDNLLFDSKCRLDFKNRSYRHLPCHCPCLWRLFS